jgi:phosphoserine phosphatase RsbU/P
VTRYGYFPPLQGIISGSVTEAPAHPPGPDGPAAELAERLRGIEAVTDAALSRLDEQALLSTLLERVKAVLDADTATVLLLDRSAGELVATSASGIEEEVGQGVRIQVGTGFAGTIAASARPVILNKVDHDTVRNPLLIERGLKSVLGVPLLAGGQVIGVLHVGSLSGRPFGRDDAELLQLAADRAAFAVQTIVAQDDRLAALALQRSLLPSALPVTPGLELAARYVTGTGNVGGDWYDAFVLPGGELGMVVGDVAGSGLPAAVIMGRMRSALRAYVLEERDPGVVLRMLDRKIQYFEPDAMATVQYALYHPESGQLAMSSAGHLPPVLAAHDRGSQLIELDVDLPIGVADDVSRRTTTFTIPPGALLCSYTDGLVERRGKVLDIGLALLTRTVGKALAQPSGLPLAEAACVAVMGALVGTTRATDDVAVLMLHRKQQTDVL